MYVQHLHHTTAATSAKVLMRQFSTNGEKLTQVAVYKYLGRLVSNNDDNAQAVRARLIKAKIIWFMLSKVLCADNATPRVCSIFYRATVQVVLLYGSKI